jgi:RNA polymerase sigma-70 factor (ECF subfamily)
MAFAREYMTSPDEAADIVQDVFLELYERYDSLTAHHVNVVAYLFAATKNRCIDRLRRMIVEQESAKRIQEDYLYTLRMKFDSLEIVDDNLFNGEDMERVIEKALLSLPERCRQIIIKHKMEGKKLETVAKELHISPKTAENQITIAYKKLRVILKKYLTLLLYTL